MNLPEDIIERLIEGDELSFELIYKLYAPKLERFAVQYVINEDEASDIVQNVFINLWEKRLLLKENTNLNNYLITLTKNKCLNFLKHAKVHSAFVNSQEVEWKSLMLNYYALEQFNDDKLLYNELSETIQNALDSLPDDCREIFLMQRMEGLKYQQIADTLGISIKTVEKKMSSSLEILRTKLKDYLSIFIFFI